MGMTLKEIFQHKAVKQNSMTGSRFICQPPPLDTDEDWILLVESVQEMFEYLQDSFQLGGSCDENKVTYDMAGFISMKRDSDKVNLIMTESEDFYRRFRAATMVAKRFNLLDKKDRIALFQAVLYGNYDV